jgi:curved DNA-binding protein CbpA
MLGEGYDGPRDPPGLYQLLGITPGASQEAVTRAYRRRARAVHPDTQPDDPTASARFKTLTGAYEVLSDPARRAAYDRARNSARPLQLGTRPGGNGPGPAGPGWMTNPTLGSNSTDVFLDARVPRPSASHLWAGPVRVDSPVKPWGDVRPQRLPPHHELHGFTRLLLRLLIAGGSE